jgi:hypothetical protein
MKTIKTTTMAFEIEGNEAIIIGARNDEFFVKTPDGIMIYTRNEMNSIYGINFVSLTNIQAVLNK